ncbi:hypothetical protein [Deinococcus sp. SL84]|uniref:hypothetical protein n=1 Tax=Deinococcus sp. SL84 TaxID=2994663 RepID=UPI0022745987|nr:hypothetical protein [Deinococcus sp. SL84]MCY1703592.1 hypothetical protein [Deinococcus sp. SL84]
MTNIIQDDINKATTAYNDTHDLLGQLESLAQDARRLLEKAEANNATALKLRESAHATHTGLPPREEVYAEGHADEDELSGLSDKELLARRLEDNVMVAEETLHLAKRLVGVA